MSDIKAGFDDKLLSIRFYAAPGDKSAHVTVEQKGLETGAERVIQRYETLSYATLDELITLRNEINETIKIMVEL